MMRLEKQKILSIILYINGKNYRTSLIKKIFQKINQFSND